MPVSRLCTAASVQCRHSGVAPALSHRYLAGTCPAYYLSCAGQVPVYWHPCNAGVQVLYRHCLLTGIPQAPVRHTAFHVPVRCLCTGIRAMPAFRCRTGTAFLQASHRHLSGTLACHVPVRCLCTGAGFMSAKCRRCRWAPDRHCTGTGPAPACSLGYKVI